MAAGGRKAARMTLEQFREKFTALARKCADPDDFDVDPHDDEFDPIEKLYHIIGSIRDRHAKFDKDLQKIEFDFENFLWDASCLDNKSGNLMGFRLIGDIPLLGCYAGGDWESPIFFVIYFDDKGSLRAYIPKEGNPYNYDKKSAFGNNVADYDYKTGTGYVSGDPRFKGCDEEVCERVFGADPDAWRSGAIDFVWPKLEEAVRDRIKVV